MRSGLVQTGAWALATTAGVVLSWLGVSSVLSESAFDPPRALPLPVSSLALPATAPSSPPAGPANPAPSSLPAQPAQPAPAHPAAPATTRPTPAQPVAPVAASTSPSSPSSPSSPTGTTAATGSVHSYLVPGGRVALDMQPDSAELVSATPDPGWQMQMWNGDQWLRIDFSQGSATNSVFVTWNGHPPDVQTVVR
jgi:hypothetical protein